MLENFKEIIDNIQIPCLVFIAAGLVVILFFGTFYGLFNA